MTVGTTAVTAVLVVLAAAVVAVAVIPSPRAVLVAAAVAVMSGLGAVAVAGAWSTALAAALIVGAGTFVILPAVRGVAGVKGRAATVSSARLITGGAVTLVAVIASAAWLVGFGADFPAQGGGGAAPTAVVHWREPVAALATIVGGVVALGIARHLAVESADERSHDADVAERRRKQERTDRRRADREAARRRGGGA